MAFNKAPLSRRNWIGFVSLLILCLLASSRWFLESGRPELRSTWTSEAAGCLLAAAAWLPLSWKRRCLRVEPQRGCGPFLAETIGTALLLTGPSLGQHIGGDRAQSTSASLALILTPLVVAVAGSAFARSMAYDVQAMLWPSLAGFAGLLLLVPEPRINGLRQGLGLAAMPVLTGLGASLSQRDSGEDTQEFTGSRPYAVATGILLAAVFFGLTALRGSVPGVLWQTFLPASFLDAATALLTLLVLGRIGSSRWSAQYLLIPLGTIVEGILLLRPSMDLHAWAGLLLLAGASFRQLWLTPDAVSS